MFPSEVDNDKIAKELGIPKSHVDEIIDIYFTDIKDKLSALEYSKVYITGFGNFEACRNPIIRFVESVKKKLISPESSVKRSPIDEYKAMQYSNALALLGDIENRKRDKERRSVLKKIKRDEINRNNIGDLEPSVQED